MSDAPTSKRALSPTRGIPVRHLVRLEPHGCGWPGKAGRATRQHDVSVSGALLRKRFHSIKQSFVPRRDRQVALLNELLGASA
jgi:hypothetical protein